jgi:poly-gamma-glutamate synthesis protein (capsule biosynthesis protein)
MMFDRTVRLYSNRHGQDYLFSCIADTLAPYDLVVGNLEGPITNYPSVSLGAAIGSPENTRFTFPIETAATLAAHNVRLVSLGNNHINDFGSDGRRQTHLALTEAGVSYFGGTALDEAVYRQHDPFPISFVSYNQFGGLSVASTSELIAQEAAAGYTVILYAHWGDEYVPRTSAMQASARRFTEAGADLIIGSHPHVVQAHETIGDTPVFYSLGNFFFDQYWEPAVFSGAMVTATITPQTIEVAEIPVTLGRDRRTCVSTSGEIIRVE